MSELPVSLLEALLMLVAMIVGSAVIIAACVLAAVGFSKSVGRLIGPEAPEKSPEQQLADAVARKEEDDAQERRWEERDRQRGRDYVDSTYVSFRMFGWVFLACYLLVGLSSIAAHAHDPGQGFPMQLMMRPIWFSLAVALLAGNAAGSRYKMRFRRLTKMEQREELARQRTKAERSHRKRLDDIRSRFAPTRHGKRY